MPRPCTLNHHLHINLRNRTQCSEQSPNRTASNPTSVPFTEDNNAPACTIRERLVNHNIIIPITDSQIEIFSSNNRACLHHLAPECLPHIHTANPHPTQWEPTAPFCSRAGRPRCPIPTVRPAPKTQQAITFTTTTTTRTTKQTPTAATAPHPRPTLPAQRPQITSDSTRTADAWLAAVCSMAPSLVITLTRMCRQR